MSRGLRIGGLVSSSGTNLQAILDACASYRINGEVVCVGSDNPEAFGLERARKVGIPTFNLDYRSVTALAKSSPARVPLSTPTDFKIMEVLQKSALEDIWENHLKVSVRAIVEYQLLQKMAEYQVDVLVLAGFMKILSPYFLDHFQPNPFSPRVLNIHPALLPAFPGTDGYGDAWNYGVKVHGATVHFVDYGEDTGPIIDQSHYERRPYDTLNTFKDKGLKLEWELYVKCLKLFCENRLKIESSPDGKRRIVTILPRKVFTPR